MNQPSTDDRLIEQLAATLREPPDDERARGLQAPIDPVLRDRLFEMMATSRASEPIPMPAANDAGRRRLVAGVVLAAAAAVALVMMDRWRSKQDEASSVVVASLPVYGLELDPGLTSQRSDTEPAGELRYRSNNQFGWLMRPLDNVAAPVDVRVCASTASGEELELDVGSLHEVDESGSVRLQGRVAALGLSPGHWTVAIAVGYPEVLGELGSVCRASTSAGIDVQRFDVELLAD